MGKQETKPEKNSSDNQETKPSNNISNYQELEKNVIELTEKVERVEHTNAVLEDKVKQYEDPNNKPRRIPRGIVRENSKKFQANSIQINPSTGERFDPANPSNTE